MTDPTNLPALSTTQAYTRRQMIAGSAIGLCGLAITGTRAGAQGATADPAKAKGIITAKAIHHEIDFTAGPGRIYEALLDSKQFTALQSIALPGASAAEIHREAGGAFSLFGGYIVGRNVELAPNRRIVQAWRAGSWAEGIYSIARFELVGQGSGTRIIFDHTGFPPDKAESLESGWHEHYWDGLRKYLV